MAFTTNDATRAAILAQAAQYDSFYLYGATEITQAAQTLQQAFPDVTFLYSLKNNPCNQIATLLFDQGFGTDAASLAEVMQSVAAGVAKEKIQYSAPGKTVRDITAALPHAILVADSISEIARIQEIAAAQGITAQIGIRIHPAFSFDSDAPATPSKFGIEETQAFANFSAWRALPNIEIVGLHVHCRSQSLSVPLLQRYHQKVIDLATRMQRALGYDLSFLNMGAGFGIPYAPSDTPIDLDAIATATHAHLSTFHQRFPSTKIYIETGRYCVGNNGVYVTKVLDKKTCGDTTFVVLANTLNGFIRPSLANMLESACPSPAAAEPLYTAQNAFTILPILQMDTSASVQKETVTLVGNLCTATDLLAKDICLPMLQCGDMIAITNAGSYAAVLSPMQFSQQVAPAQLLLQADGTIISAV